MKFFPYVALAVLSAGCGDAKTGSHIGNPVSIGFTVSSALTSADARPQFTDASGRLYTIETARAFVTNVQLAAPAGIACADIEPTAFSGSTCNDAVDGAVVSVDQGYALDLLAASNLPGVTVPDLKYTRFTYRLSRASAGAPGVVAGDPLLDHGFVISAGFDNEGLANTIELRLDFDEDITIEPSAGLVPGSRFVVDYDAGQWISGVAIEQCIEDDVDDDQVVIDPESECGELPGEIESEIRSNVRESSELRDDD
ncbi:MAG: hypothetical protein R3E66_05170 [bacterium]